MQISESKLAESWIGLCCEQGSATSGIGLDQSRPNLNSNQSSDNPIRLSSLQLLINQYSLIPMKPLSKSLQLLSYNPTTSKFHLNEKALLFLQDLNKPLAITTISGSICSGKSYLLNEVIGEEDFVVSSKSLPETKGIWMSRTPLLSLDQKYYHVFLDGEGLSSIDKDSDYDIKLLLLEIMMSSTFIYNSFGAIEQSALETLRSSIGLGKYCGDWKKLGFPDLVWVARDFNLALVDRDGNRISEKEYLESAFREISTDEIPDYGAKNETRKVLREAFVNKYCYTLPRPATNESVLRNLGDNPQKIKPQFLAKLAQIRKDIICRSRPKEVNGSPIEGSLFASMIRSLVKNINEIGGISACDWNSISLQNNHRVYEKCMDRFKTKLSTLELSLPRTGLDNVLSDLFTETERQYSSKTLSFQDSNQDLLDLKSVMQKQISQILLKNTELLARSSMLEFQELWEEAEINSKLESPCDLKESLERVVERICSKQQYRRCCERLSEVILGLSSKVRYLNIEVEQHQSMKGLRDDYQVLKGINTSNSSNISKLEQRIKVLDSNIEKLEKQKQVINQTLQQYSVERAKYRDQSQSRIRQNQQLKTLTKQYQLKLKDLQQMTKTKEQQMQCQSKIFLQQKRVTQQQSKFYQNQIRELKENIETVRANNERSNLGLLQNNQILKRLENIKSRDTENRHRDMEKYSHLEEEGKMREIRSQNGFLETKVRKLEVSVAELSEKVRREQEKSGDLRRQLDCQLEINREKEESRRSYQDMVVSLESNLEVMQVAQEREKRLYEQSVLRLIENVERREEQYKNKRKSDAREKYSRHQY